MKKILSFAIFAYPMFFSEAARAEDTWTGPYIGVYAESNSSEVGYEDFGCWASCTKPSLSGSSIGAGAVLGYDIQTSENLVLGLVADLGSGSSRKYIGGSELGLETIGTLTWHSDVDYQSTIRGRIGVTQGRSMVYLTGGLAIAQATFAVEGRNIPSYYPNHSENYDATWKGTLTGKTYGAGVEHKFNRFSLKAEILYSKYSQVSSCFANSDGANAGICWNEPRVIPPIVHNSYSTTKFRVGLNYRF